MRVFQWNERALLASGKIFFASRYSGGPGGFLPWHRGALFSACLLPLEGVGGDRGNVALFSAPAFAEPSDGVVKPTSRASKPVGAVGLQGCW